ncbi:MAG TPA: ABC transporter substrate-binding protein [Brumimicrobium sp.]|nr:ABC transporter substrate-binding protein [Brumimicrobium sp.]
MKPYIILYSFLALFMIFTSCESKVKNDFAEIGNITSLDTIVNDFAEAFQIIYHHDDIEINIIDPSTKEIINTYKVGKESQGAYNTFTHDLNRVVAMSTTHIGMMRKLGLEERVSGVSNYKYLCHPVSKSSVMEVGDMGMADAESFLAVKPDVILYSGFNLNAPVLNKLEQANLKSFLIYEWKETHPLGRAEWIKVFGVLFQKQQEAKAIYDEIKSKYYSITDKLKLAEKGPNVFAGTYFGDVFNVPAGNSYMAKLFKDANINYVYSRTAGTGSLTLSLEELITKNTDTEYWLNPSVATKSELLAQSEKFDLMKSVKTGKVYSYFNNTNCFWENSAIEPHKVLEDFGKIFHPTLFDDRELTFYSRVKD